MLSFRLLSAVLHPGAQDASEIVQTRLMQVLMHCKYTHWHRI